MGEQDVYVVRGEARHTLEELAASARPHLEALCAERALAFGSYARGAADAFSDLDLLVVLSTDLPRLERGRLLRRLQDALPVPLDALVYTPAEYERGKRRGLGLFALLEREGVTIHERRAP